MAPTKKQSVIETETSPRKPCMYCPESMNELDLKKESLFLSESSDIISVKKPTVVPYILLFFRLYICETNSHHMCMCIACGSIVSKNEANGHILRCAQGNNMLNRTVLNLLGDEDYINFGNIYVKDHYFMNVGVYCYNNDLYLCGSCGDESCTDDFMSGLCYVFAHTKSYPNGKYSKVMHDRVINCAAYCIHCSANYDSFPTYDRIRTHIMDHLKESCKIKIRRAWWD